MEEIRIVISALAEAELKAECLFLEDHYSTRYAERFRIEFYEQVSTIFPHPLKYPECRYLLTKKRIYRNIIWGNCLIIYRFKHKEIQVLTLLSYKTTSFEN